MPGPTSPYASVIVPAYNAAATLAACLDALACQTIPAEDYEVIVVDDGSSDETTVVARRGGAAQILVCPHRGPAETRNAGAAAARGEVLVFTDADCEPQPDWLAEMLSPLADRAIAGVKGAYTTRQTAVVPRLAQCEFEERYARLSARPYIDFFDTYSAALRTAAFGAAGGFDPAFPYPNNEDVDLAYRLAGLGFKMVFAPRARVCHRHAASWPIYLRLKFRRGYWRMIVYRLHPAKALADSYTPQLLKLQVGLVYGAVLAAALGLLGGRGLAAAGLAAAAAIAALLISALPFTRLATRRDPGVARWAPFFILARAAAFAAGVAGGAIGMLTFRPRRS
ncbi:MAG TPA: glycosyltransferase [Anaerolineae bacterium]